MAVDWIKMRCGLDRDCDTARIAVALGVSNRELISGLYVIASMFAQYGKYGKLRAPTDLIDSYVELPGLADQLLAVGWLANHDGVLCLKRFCTVSAGRKSLGRAVRELVLSAGQCVVCGSTESLSIDHIVPIVRGGGCDVGNLQALCRTCNARKGRKTMAEFMAGEAK